MSTYNRVVAADETASLAPTVRARLATEMADPTSDAGASLSGTFAPISNSEGTVVVTDPAYGAVGDWSGTTGTDNLSAFNAAGTAMGTLGYTRIVVPPGDYYISDSWHLDGEAVELVIMSGATIRTTAATTQGHAVAFMGNGLQTPNDVGIPQRGRFMATGGGRIVAVNAADNALGIVRVKNANVEGLTLTGGQHALAAQYGVDNLTVERVVATAGTSGAGVNVVGTCKRVSIRDIHVITCYNGIAVYGDATAHSEDVHLENVVVAAATHYGVTVEKTDRVRIVGGNLVGTTKSVYLALCTAFSVLGTSMPNGMGLGASTSPLLPPSTALAIAGGWSAFGAPYGTPAARRDANGYVHLEGVIKSGALTSGTTLTTLPAGFRPITRIRAGVLMVLGSGPALMDLFIDPDGKINLSSTLDSAVALAPLEGITFPIAST